MMAAARRTAPRDPSARGPPRADARYSGRRRRLGRCAFGAWAIALPLVLLAMGTPIFGGPPELGEAAGSATHGPLALPLVRGTAASPLAPQLHVAASPLQGPAPLTVTFWANITGATGTSQVRWDFGDGAIGSGSPVVHVYTAGGWFNATATASNNATGWSATGTVTLHATGAGGPSPLAVALSSDPAQGTSPLPVSVTISASGGSAPYRGNVCFGDGTQCAPIPAGWDGSPITFDHTYTAAGTFTIVASADDASGTTIASTAGLTVLGPAPLSAHGVESPLAGNAPLSVSFDAQASGGTAPYAVLWDFGDGTQGTGTVGTPTSHTYSTGGSYTPTLTVTDSAGHRAVYTLPTLQVQPATTSQVGNSTSPWTSGWLASHSTAIGAVGLLAVMGIFALLVERQRRQEVTRQAKELVEAMEKSQEPP